MPTVTTQSLEIGYVDDGPPEGPAVLLVHGWPDSALGWASLADRLVTHGYRVIVPDLRGSGSTGFRAVDTVPDGTGTALAQDTFDLSTTTDRDEDA